MTKQKYHVSQVSEPFLSILDVLLMHNSHYMAMNYLLRGAQGNTAEQGGMDNGAIAAINLLGSLPAAAFSRPVLSV